MKARLYATALALLLVALLLIGCGGGATTPSQVTDETTTVFPTRAGQSKVAKADAPASTSGAEQTTTPDAIGSEPGDVAATTGPSASNADAIHACIEEHCTLPIDGPAELADAVAWLLSAEEK